MAKFPKPPKGSVRVKADCEVAFLSHPPEQLPMRELRNQIEIELGTHLRSHRDLKGIIDSETEIYEIGCLLKIRELLREKRGKR
jgi:hypothetical protein